MNKAVSGNSARKLFKRTPKREGLAKFALLMTVSLFSVVAQNSTASSGPMANFRPLTPRLARQRAADARVTGEPQLRALQWTDVSLQDLQPRTRPLFDLDKLFALARPVQPEAQQGWQNIGGYLYNPESYISVEPRLQRLSNKPQLQLLPERNLRAYFGLLHAHTFASDGIGDARDAFRMARDLAGLDFFATTEHSEYWWSKASSEWHRQRTLARAESRPDFLALAGFEYSHPLQGHVVVLNSSGWTSFLEARSLESFFEWLARPEQNQALAIFAHPGFHAYRNWFDLRRFEFDPRVAQRVVGVETIHRNVWHKSLRGYSGRKPHLDEALDAGWWLGPVASQDNHTPYWGVADQSRLAVLMERLSESSLFESLARRHFYSTQSPQLQMMVGLYSRNELKGIMGDIVKRDTLGPTDSLLRVRLFEPNPLLRPQKIEIIVNGKKERTLTFLDSAHSGNVAAERESWWERVTNNGILTARPWVWALDLRAHEDPDIFQIDVPLRMPECATAKKTQTAHNQWALVVRFYQGDRAELMSQSSPVIVRCT